MYFYFSIDLLPIGNGDSQPSAPPLFRRQTQEAISLRCPGTGRARWIHNGQAIKSRETMKVHGNTLTISKVLPDHAGKYACIGTYPNGDNYRKIFTLEVNGKHCNGSMCNRQHLGLNSAATRLKHLEVSFQLITGLFNGEQ